jgi:hypothetical protein
MSTIDLSFFVPQSRLDMYEEFSSFDHIDKAAIIKFIQLCYHKDSPLIEVYESLPERLQAALKESGLPEDRAWSLHMISVGVNVVSEKMVDPAVSAILDKIDDMVACFLSRIQNSAAFDQYITLQIFEAELKYHLRKPVAGKMGEEVHLKGMDTKVKIKQPYLDMRKEIQGLRAEIFHGNEKVAKKVDDKISRPNANMWAKKVGGK